MTLLISVSFCIARAYCMHCCQPCRRCLPPLAARPPRPLPSRKERRTDNAGPRGQNAFQTASRNQSITNQRGDLFFFSFGNSTRVESRWWWWWWCGVCHRKCVTRHQCAANRPSLAAIGVIVQSVHAIIAFTIRICEALKNIGARNCWNICNA